MKLLSTAQIFEKSIYTVAPNDTLLSICLDRGVTPQFLIEDNDICIPPKVGDILLIVNRGKTFVLTVEYLNGLSAEDIEKLREKNHVDYIFIGQILLSL